MYVFQCNHLSSRFIYTDPQCSTAHGQHWPGMTIGTQRHYHPLALPGSLNGGAPAQSPYSHHMSSMAVLSTAVTYQPSPVSTPQYSSLPAPLDPGLATSISQMVPVSPHLSTIPPCPFPTHTAPHPSLQQTATYPPTVSYQLPYQQPHRSPSVYMTSYPPRYSSPVAQPHPLSSVFVGQDTYSANAMSMTQPSLHSSGPPETQHHPFPQPTVAAVTTSQSTTVSTGPSDEEPVITDPVSAVEPQQQEQQQVANKPTLSNPLTTCDQSSNLSLPVVPPDGNDQPADLLMKEACLLASNLPSNEPTPSLSQHLPQQQELSHSYSQDEDSSCHQPQANSSNQTMSSPTNENISSQRHNSSSLSLNEYLNRMPEELQDREVERKHIVRIALYIKNFRHTGRCLNLLDSDIEQLSCNSTETAADLAYNILWSGWYQRRPGDTNPTYRKLVVGLYDADETEAIEKLLQLQ